MKKLIFLCVFLVSIHTGLAAQNTDKASMDAHIDSISSAVFDIEARYWAYRISGPNADISFEELDKHSKNWVGSQEENAKLMQEINKYIKNGKVSPLTPKEKESLDNAKQQISELLMPGKKDKALQKTLTSEYCMDLQARYWAYRVLVIKDTNVKELETLSVNWGEEPQYLKDFLAKLKKLVKKGKADELSKTEAYILEACIQKSADDQKKRLEAEEESINTTQK